MGVCIHSRGFTLETKGSVQIRCKHTEIPCSPARWTGQILLRPTQIKPVPVKYRLIV